MSDTIKTNRAGLKAAQVVAQHTPGPWSAVTATHDIRGNELDFQESVVQISQIPGGVIARMTMQAEREANARLIAAAPDMLEALLLMVRGRPDKWAFDKARAAIAKATGSTP